jgi:hypothetical protein
MESSERPGEVEIDGKLVDELRPEKKGNGLLGKTEDELEQFLWLRCSTRRGEALGTRGEASDGLSGRRGDLTGARVLGSERETRGRRRTGALGFPAMAAVSSL